MEIQKNWIELGKAKLKQGGQIVDGYTNLIKDSLGTLPDNEKELYEARYGHCLGCAMRDGNKCSMTRSIQHVVTGEWINGCGCQLDASTKSPSYECPAGKWGSVAHLL